MPCSACETLPTLPQGRGRLFLWVPIPHSHSKLLHALTAQPIEAQTLAQSDVQALEDLGLAISIAEGSLKSTLERIAGILAREEMHSSRALFLPGDVEPRWQDCGRVEPLTQLLHRAHAELLLQVLAENRLTSHFQPIVCARDPKQVVAHEALVRGTDGDGNWISPGPLFEMAREAHLLYQLDLAARRSAIQAATLQKLEGDLFINFNPTAIYDPAFCLRSTVWAIHRAGIPPERVVFEVNESDRSQDIRHLPPFTGDLAVLSAGGLSYGPGRSRLWLCFLELDPSITPGLDQAGYAVDPGGGSGSLQGRHRPKDPRTGAKLGDHHRCRRSRNPGRVAMGSRAWRRSGARVFDRQTRCSSRPYYCPRRCGDPLHRRSLTSLASSSELGSWRRQQ
ncbi:EAL domain-containing protein [Thermostichus vulcanus]|uniref:EAL domain-containing protein n=1 Tax=Thermostichus vulcanus TaxID=32053 RepID=UPI001FCAB13D|nr:EAL domain-containing protein [Thermostichus vulcanus]